jgi:hypothetical protein
MRDNPVVLRTAIGAVVLASAVTAAGVHAATAYTACGVHRGFTVFANGVTCPTAKKSVRRIGELPYRGPKVTVRSIAGYVCVATFNRKTRQMKAGSCLKVGTTATGFGWTRDGAAVPLPPGADASGSTTG